MIQHVPALPISGLTGRSVAVICGGEAAPITLYCTRDPLGNLHGKRDVSGRNVRAKHFRAEDPERDSNNFEVCTDLLLIGTVCAFSHPWGTKVACCVHVCAQMQQILVYWHTVGRTARESPSRSIWR